MNKKNIIVVSLLQSLGLVAYCVIIGWLIFYKAEQWFGPMNQMLGSTLFLLIFVMSALICGVIAFAYPVIHFLETKKGKESVAIVGYTVVWLFLFVLIIAVLLSVL